VARIGATKVRMADVAEAAGVSRATASLVLSGSSLPIAAETRERVIATARRMGYRANRLAQNLARRRSGLIGTTVYSLHNPFYAGLVARLNEAVRQRGYRLIFEATGYGEAEQRQAVEDLTAWSVEGMILYWNEKLAPLTGLARENPATVLLGSCALPEEIDGVQFDIYGGCAQVLDHLRGLGHRRFGFLAQSEPAGDGRYAALLDRATRDALPEPVVMPLASETADEAYAAARALAARPDRPTALLCLNDTVAVGALSALRDLGVSVPGEVSLVGFDDNWAARHADVALTTVALPVAEMAATGTDFLFRRLSGAASERQFRLLAPALVLRDSTAPPAGRG
jgi:DNA-binding LacI/PurR family transcriptional regulator